MPDHTSVKTCCKCGQPFPATPDYFHRNKRSKDGLQSRCKACHIAGVVASQRAHPDVSRARRKRWAANHPDQVRAAKKYYNTTDKAKQLKVQWNAENRERKITQSIAWRKANPAKSNAVGHRRRAKLRSLPDTFTHDQWIVCLDYWGGRCAYCGNPGGLLEAFKLSVDHFIPLSAADCPGNVATNIVPACVSCNSGKQDHSPVEWVMQKFGKRRGKRILDAISAYFDFVRKSEAD